MSLLAKISYGIQKPSFNGAVEITLATLADICLCKPWNKDLLNCTIERWLLNTIGFLS